MRRSIVLLVLICGLVFRSPALGQSAATQSSDTTNVTLGRSVVALTGPWKFHIGDDPRWADPNFDDSQWETTDLRAKEGSMDPNSGANGYVPGWTAKGHPGYSGFAWYRLRVHVVGTEGMGTDGALALLAPSIVDDSYQIFANGRLIGSFGDFSSSVPTIYATRPLMFALPANGNPNGTFVLAFRFYMAPRTLLQIDSGGMHNPPFIGLASAITAAWHVGWENVFKTASSALASALLYLVFTLLILMLYAFDRTETILFWPLAACGTGALFFFLAFSTDVSTLLTALRFNLLSAVLAPLFAGFWMLTFWAYFDLQDRKWIRNAVGIIVLWAIALNLLLETLTLSGPRVPHFILTAYSVNGDANDAVVFILLVLIATFGMRRSQRKDWMVLLALIFFGTASLYPVLQLLHIRTLWFPFGIYLNLTLLAIFASLFCFSVVLLRRFRNSQRRQQAMEEDVRQAQEVQQVLIPETLPQIPGLTIESEYRPAREVGGDFFQIIPHPSDGSVLIVVGDVTGKGLQAGMLVALIVGTIRTAVEKSFEPLDVIQTLNRRLCGRGHSHATCLALRIDADGSVTLANAGHMPVYLNGKERAMEGALPLGMIPNAEFSVTRLKIEPGDRLMLLSDGVAEAQDERGQLFGFDRIQFMLARPITAAEVAATAQAFGQQDDISVVCVTRTVVRQQVGTSQVGQQVGV